ncbi:DUF2516 family protein [Geodermatophilus sp. URMC 64]
MGFDGLFMTGLHYAVFVLAAWAFVDALIRPATGYVAAGKLTKPAWVAITGLSALVEFGMTPLATFPVPLAGFLWLPAVVAAIVYLVDVRPALRGLRRGNSSW